MRRNPEFDHIKKTSKKLENLKKILQDNECVSYNRDFDKICKIPLINKEEDKT